MTMMLMKKSRAAIEDGKEVGKQNKRRSRGNGNKVWKHIIHSRTCMVAYALKAFSFCLKVFNRFRAITLDWVLPKKIPAIFIPYPLT